MNRYGLVVLALSAVVLCAVADRRRPDNDQHTRYHRHHHDDDDDDDQPRMVHLDDYDSNSWRHEHNTWKPSDKRNWQGHHPSKGQWKGNTPKNGYKNERRQNERNDEDSDRRRSNESRHQASEIHDNNPNQTRTNDWKKKSYEKRGQRQDTHGNRNREQTQRDHHREHGREYAPENEASDSHPQHSIRSREPEGHTETPTATSSSEQAASFTDAPPAADSVEVVTAPASWSGDPPPHDQVAAMARFIVHASDWAAMATISTRPHTLGAPFANVFSVADGTKYRSSGVPYMYLTDWEMSVKDLRANNKASLTMSLAQSDYCAAHQYDPESPLCAHVILSGTVRQLDESEEDYTFAKDALFARHPAMADWPVGHEWFVAMLEIEDIIVLDFFGGAITVPKDEYFAASPFTNKAGRSVNTVDSM